jgi:heme exporter protein A
MTTEIQAATKESTDASASGVPHAIAARRLRRDYGDETVIHDLSFELAAGETLVVLGPNGAGKSTLLRMLATLLRPSGGELEVLGAELPRQAWKARGRIGYLGHSALLYADLTLTEALLFHANLHDVDEPNVRVRSLLEQVGLERRAGQLVRTLSAGQLQRAAVCRCVLHEPELLLLDEPGAHLDPSGYGTVEHLIGRGASATRVVVTHDVEGGLADADRALALGANGTVAYEGAANGISASAAREIYAERPR